MKKNLLYTIFAAIASIAIVAACTTPSGQQETPAQIAAQVCPPTQAALTSLQALNGLPEGATKDLATVAPIVNAVCSASATVTTVNLQSLAQNALPTIITIVKASPLSSDDQNKIILDVTAAQIIVDAVMAAQVGGTAPIVMPAPVAAPSASPAATTTAK